jgi:hypothetical protein
MRMRYEEYDIICTDSNNTYIFSKYSHSALIITLEIQSSSFLLHSKHFNTLTRTNSDARTQCSYYKHSLLSYFTHLLSSSLTSLLSTFLSSHFSPLFLPLVTLFLLFLLTFHFSSFTYLLVSTYSLS